MSNTPKAAIVSRHETAQSSLRSYVTGFVSSLYLTLTAYVLVAHHLLPKTGLVIAIIGLAIIQFMVQLFYFLHLGREAKPRWKLLVFYFMLMVVAILVFGSLWIMSNLNYHMLPPDELKHHMRVEEGL